jgi:UDP-arabinose 4-epimerase
MQKKSSKRVLVTGGAGYIGSHVCKALALAGYEPIVYDNLVYGHETAVRWGPFVRGDIMDRDRLDAVLAKYRPVSVMHFAAFAYVGESVKDPLKYYRNNVQGSLTLIEAATHSGVSNFIFSSTCAVYGIPVSGLIVEDMPLNPINPYGESKRIVEQMLANVAFISDMRFVALRYFNAAGADPDGDIGEDHDPETHLIPLVIKSALGRFGGLTVFGDDYATPDGTCIRDYVHVSDIADAHVLALGYLRDGAESLIVNLGTGQGNSVLEIIRAVERVTGKTVSFQLGPRRAGDPPMLVAGHSLATTRLGWQPRFNEIEETLRHAYAWECRNP